MWFFYKTVHFYKPHSIHKITHLWGELWDVCIELEAWSILQLSNWPCCTQNGPKALFRRKWNSMKNSLWSHPDLNILIASNFRARHICDGMAYANICHDGIAFNEIANKRNVHQIPFTRKKLATFDPGYYINNSIYHLSCKLIVAPQILW